MFGFFWSDWTSQDWLVAFSIVAGPAAGAYCHALLRTVRKIATSVAVLPATTAATEKNTSDIADRTGRIENLETVTNQLGEEFTVLKSRVNGLDHTIAMLVKPKEPTITDTVRT